MADEGEYELKDDGDMAELKGAPGDGWGKGPKPGDPDFVPPKVVVEVVRPAKVEEPAQAEGAVTPEDLEDAADIHKHKAMGMLAYVFFMIPLLAAPESKFARFHANQGLISLLLWVAAVVGVVVIELLKWGNGLVLGRIAILFYFFSCILYLLQPALLIGALAMMLLGIVNAANGEKKRLPLVGTWQLIK